MKRRERDRNSNGVKHWYGVSVNSYGVSVCVSVCTYAVLLCELTWEARVNVDFYDILVILTLKLCLTFRLPIDFCRLLHNRCCKIRLITHLSVCGRSCMYESHYVFLESALSNAWVCLVVRCSILCVCFCTCTLASSFTVIFSDLAVAFLVL